MCYSHLEKHCHSLVTVCVCVCVCACVRACVRVHVMYVTTTTHEYNYRKSCVNYLQEDQYLNAIHLGPKAFPLAQSRTCQGMFTAAADT